MSEWKNLLKRYDRPGAPPTGEFVKYSDYAELSRQHDELLAALKQAVWHIANFHYGKAEHLLRQAIAKAQAHETHRLYLPCMRRKERQEIQSREMLSDNES